MDNGRLIQVATPSEIYEQPNSRWVADFVGDVNLIEGRVVATDDAGMVIESAAAGRVRAAPKHGVTMGDTVWVALRPEKLRLATERPATAADNCAVGIVSEIAYLGDLSVYKVRLETGFEIKAAAANMTRLIERPINWDERVWLSWPSDAGIVLTR
jgi:putrescine transport system ATP-binding protein